MNVEATKPYVIGLDLGGTNSVFGIVDSRGEIKATTAIKTQGYEKVEDYVAASVEALSIIIDEMGGIGKIKAMGIGAPNGNFYSGTIEFAPNLRWKGIVPLAELFSKALGIPVALTNDANAAAIGEMTYPQWCEQQTVFARRMVALIVNEVTNGMQGKGDDGSLVGLMQFAAGASLNWMPVLGAASATLGR